MLFTNFKNSKQFLRLSRSKSEATTGSLWEAQTKTAKKDYFNKILSFPRFFEINTLNFQEMFLDIFKKFCWKEFLKIQQRKNYINLFIYIYINKKNSF